VELIKALLKGNHHELADADIEKLASKLEGFSGADLKSLCNDAR
jgi:SpoVK/Ycf46/Vps4 family AAA+-type ATPase